MKMSAGEANLLAKLEQIDHNQKKIMRGILNIAETFTKNDFKELTNIDDENCNLATIIQEDWNWLDVQLKEHKKLTPEEIENLTHLYFDKPKKIIILKRRKNKIWQIIREQIFLTHQLMIKNVWSKYDQNERG